MEIVCIIPSTCEKASLKKCLISLDAAKTENVRIFKIVVTANENAKKMTKKLKIDCLVSVKQSFGFSEMINAGIYKGLELYNPDYFLIINDDAWIKKNFFKKFNEIQQKYTCDVFCPIVFKPDKKTLDSFGSEYFTSGYAKNAQGVTRQVSVDAKLATAACVIVGRSILEKMNKSYGFMFNPILYYYMDDVEFSLRCLGLGGTIKKFKNLTAYHVGSYTSGVKSYFTMYHNYRNVIWVIILTWPIKYILKKFLSILIVQLWVIFYSLLKFGPKLYLSAISDTFCNMVRLQKNRKKILASYSKEFKFDSVFSRFVFRTKYGQVF